MKLFVMRHPETKGNKEEIIQDPMEGNLSDYGKSQILPVVSKMLSLNLTEVYSSDSERCRDLAETFAQKSGIDIIYDSMLREVNSGDWIGMKKSDVKKLIAQKKRPNNGEDLEQLMVRAKGILKCVSKENGKILLITHGCLIKMLIGITKNMDAYEADEKVSVENCEIVKLNLHSLNVK